MTTHDNVWIIYMYIMWVAAYMGSPPGFEPVFPLHMERCVCLHYKDVPINSNIGYTYFWKLY